MKFNVYSLRNSSILYLYAQRHTILINPDYQRMGEVWTLDKRQLLIDSIINEFDIPKIYFHDLKDFNKKSKYEHAIIDGRQRLETIWSFIDGKFSLAEDIEYLRNPKQKIGDLTYGELASQHPQIKQLFDSYSLSVFSVQTDDLDLIEEMFSRLNEAVPLNAAEKRNAYGGPLPKIVREIASSFFFSQNLKISNKRYQHRDLAAKFVYLTYNQKVVDTKKIYLDNFFKNAKGKSDVPFKRSATLTKKILQSMNHTFVEKDKLLRSSGMAVLYFLLFFKAKEENWLAAITRSKLMRFEEKREKNREMAANDITAADYDLLEFDRLTQTPNDAYAIRFRLDLLVKHVKK